ncbi:alpha/beta hydrolase [Actinocorallia longicatena]|uniref:Alpha/beta hydrolase n=1 Tax=Actinocorallia longicatena TaxID=111803 RepID=A0ABP6QG98_9ACTN
MRPTLLLACLALVAGCTAAPAAAPPVAPPVPSIDTARLERFYDQRPRWHACPGHRGFACADVKVPLDYRDPDGRPLAIAVTRLPATGARQGSLLVNPGGPGASGLDLAFGAREVVGAKVRRRYDIVGFDPRGVGRSNGIRCLDDDELDRFYRTDSTPDTGWERQRLRTMSRRYAEECQEKSGWILPHLGTDSVARDMDVIRAVVGDRNLNYLGFSYGTQLGQVYAGLFPGRVRRMVLDSVVDSGLWAGAITESQLTSLDGQFDLFLGYCVRRGCPLGATTKAANDRLWRLFGQADREPLRGDGGRPVTDSDLHTATIALSMTEELWPLGVRAFAKVLQGDGRDVLALADLARGRGGDGRYDSTVAANVAVTCLETPQDVREKEATDEHIAAMARRSPLFAESNLQLACSYWKAPGLSQQAITPKGIGPVLLLGNTKDFRTPLPWARSVAARFPGAVLVTNEASGHIVYGRGACVDRAVEGYLLTGRLPDGSLRCHDAGPYS